MSRNIAEARRGPRPVTMMPEPPGAIAVKRRLDHSTCGGRVVNKTFHFMLS
jgi:hypothetical protein